MSNSEDKPSDEEATSVSSVSSEGEAEPSFIGQYQLSAYYAHLLSSCGK